MHKKYIFVSISFSLQEFENVILINVMKFVTPDYEFWFAYIASYTVLITCPPTHHPFCGTQRISFVNSLTICLSISTDSKAGDGMFARQENDV